MASYTPRGYGRTRRPKHLEEQIPSTKQTGVLITTVAASSLSNGLSGSNTGENGYRTENQKFFVKI